MFDQRVPAVSDDIVFTWRVPVEDSRTVGHSFSQPDLILKARRLHGCSRHTCEIDADIKSTFSG
jgi:hypothetical protein